MLNVLSLGAGVQSSTMALMAAHGEITPMPDAAIFADTQAEPDAVYVWLDWLEKQLPFPVYRVSKGDLFEAATRLRLSKNGKYYTKAAVPARLVHRFNGKTGLMMRQCTAMYKLEPIYSQLRKLRSSRTAPVRMWVGISTDEAARMKPSKLEWVENIWPLIEKGISRQQCLLWMGCHGYPLPPRSACVFCPFQSDREWASLKERDPKGFSRAVAFEKAYQDAYRRIPTVMGFPYLHKSLMPLEKVRFTQDARDVFDNECAGICGV